MKETYIEMKNRHQEEFNNFPCFFAFNNKQFEEGKKELGVTNDNELYHGYSGMYYRKTDAKKLHELLEKNDEELRKALETDDDFFYDAILTELGNHEFCITYDWEPVFTELGLEAQTVFKDERTKSLCKKAKQDYLKSCENM